MAKLKPMTVPEKHKYKIAKQTLRMRSEMVGVMGGMSKKQAREVLNNLRKAGKIR